MNPYQSVVSGRIWTVAHVDFRGVVRNVSGELTDLLSFRAELLSGESRCVVEVQVDARTLDHLLKEIETAANVARHPDHAARTWKITNAIEELLAVDLSFSWDPVRFPRWQLGEKAGHVLEEIH